MSGVWGPQPYAVAQVGRPRSRVAGAFWLAVLVSFVLGVLSTTVGTVVMFGSRLPASYSASTPATLWLSAQILLSPLVYGFPLVVGFVYGRRRRRRPDGTRVMSILGVILFTFPAVAYLAGYGLSALHLPRRQHQQRTSTVGTALVGEGARGDALQEVQVLAATAFGRPGGHAGWTETGEYISANPRGGVLVIGPPGSGKSSAVLIPSVIVAPGACVASSIKGDVMGATARVRARLGMVWHFDPGGEEETTPGVKVARWSPLVSVHNWEDARRMANRMAQPMRKPEGGEGNGAHFTDRARDWLEVLLYAAVLGAHPIAVVADWANTPTDTGEGGSVETVVALLCEAEEHGDRGARIARIQLEGLLALDARERSGVASSLVRMMRLYGSVVARDLGESPNFDPVTFVRSSDTLYITASPEKQAEYAPLIASLLEEIRFTVYARHRAEEAGREPVRPHVTFVLDEANNTAPIPLPAIISEAGGQSLHVIVGIQDLSRARSRWGKEADGFLTLFPTKIILSGLVEPYTLDALSNAAGEYDRQMIGYSESTTYVGQYNIPVRQTNPSYSVQRQKVLHQGDIAQLPPGCALLFEGAQWWRVYLGMHWQHPTWRRVIDSSSATRAVLASLPSARTEVGGRS